MNIFLIAIVAFTAFRWVTYKRDDFQIKSVKERATILLHKHKFFYACFGFLAFVAYMAEVGSPVTAPISPVPVVDEQVVKKDTSNLDDIKIANAEFFYLQMGEDQKLHHVGYNFSYFKTSTDKYVISFKKPVPKTDDVTSQVFIGALAVIYREHITDSHGGDPSKIFEFVPLAVPKNQSPKPCCKQVMRTKIGNSYYYFSNLAASDESNSDLAAFVVWKEIIE